MNIDDLPPEYRQQAADQLGSDTSNPDSSLEAAWDTQWHALAHDLPEPIPQYKFHPTRKFRFDRAWPRHMIAVELNGGTQGYAVNCHNCGVRVRAKTKSGEPGKEIRIPGNHARRSVMNADMEKFNLAQSMGWVVLQYGTEQVHSDPFKMVEEIRHVLLWRHQMAREFQPLSPREKEVLSLIAGGFKTTDIAVRLDCADHTITSHVDNILRKLNANSRTHAVAIAMAARLITDDEIPWGEDFTLEDFINTALKTPPQTP
jgi:DNA-binding CsgD family transcriptional regulator